MQLNKQRVTLLAILAISIVLWRLLGIGETQPSPPEFILYVQQPKPAEESLPPVGSWATPTDVVAIGDRLFVLDSGNDRIVEMDRDGKSRAVLCEAGDCQFLLKDPRAMVAHQEQLYVANTGAGQIVVLSTSGSVVKTIDIVIPGADGREKFSPSGIVVSPAGDMYVTDAVKKLVLQVSSDGRSASVFLGETGESEKYRVSRPMGVALDAWGNVYVADSASGRIRKYSPERRHLQEFALRTNPSFFSPAYVAVDVKGNVYFTDNQSRMINVYDNLSNFVGVVGLLDARKVDSPGVLRDPSGLHLSENTLYVADKSAGVFAFRVNPDYWKTTQSSRTPRHP